MFWTVRNWEKIHLFSPDHETFKKIIRVWQQHLRMCFGNFHGELFQTRGRFLLGANPDDACGRGSSSPSWRRGPVLVPLAQSFLHCSPSAADKFFVKKHGVNGNSVNLQTIIQRGKCVYLSANTVVKKKGLSLIAFGIYSNDLPRRALRCQGFFISNIFPNKIFVKIG